MGYLQLREFAGMGFVLVILALITITIVVAVWQGFKSWQVKTASIADMARDGAYRKLVEESVAVQKKMAEDISDLRSRIASMEKILREVE